MFDAALSPFGGRIVPPILPSSTAEKLRYEEDSLLFTINQLVGNEWSFGARYQLTFSDLETLFLWWADVLRANTGVKQRELPSARKQTEILAQKLTTSEILRRIRRLEELRDHLGRNIQEALAIEVAFLGVFTF